MARQTGVDRKSLEKWDVKENKKRSALQSYEPYRFARLRSPPQAGKKAGQCVGMTGFEPATSRPPDERATGLRYIPKIV
jgi:hypothetical protein